MPWANRRRNAPAGLSAGPAAAASLTVGRYFELSVLGLVTSGYLAVLGSGYLDVPTAAVMAAGLLLRALMVTGILPVAVSGRFVLAATIAYIGFYPLDYLFVSQDFVTATVHLVFFLAVIKVLTAQAARDYVFLGIIGFLELLAASILSANVTFFIFLAVFLLCGVATFASSEMRRSLRRPHTVARAGVRRLAWRLGALTLSVSLGILVLTAGLFFLLPRTAQAAFRHLVPERYHVPGFSNEMTLGEIGEIQKRQTAVMHVRIVNGPRIDGLKWRGVALSQFDGRRWFNPAEPPVMLKVTDSQVQLADRFHQWRGEGIGYEVRLNSMSSDALFFAGSPALVRINAPVLIRTSTDSYRLGMASPEGLRYGAYSFVDRSAPGEERAAEPASPGLRFTYLQLPRVDPRIGRLVARVTEGAVTEEARTRAVERYLQTNFRYTTTLLDREVPDPLAHFLFERRAGHCEYFASAMAVMLRVMGIPARVATGFQSGVYNPVSGWYVIRASDAHSWVEAYLPNRGWATFDPTPPGEDVPRSSIWSRLGFYVDAAETFWQDWVLNYNLDRQLTLASEFETSGRSFGSRWFDRVSAAGTAFQREAVRLGRQYGLASVFAVVIAVLAWLLGPRLWAWWRTRRRVLEVQRGRACASDATLLYERMLRAARRRGFEKPAWMTPVEFARVMKPSPAALLVGQFTSAYNELRFGGDASAAARMMVLLEDIEHAPRT